MRTQETQYLSNPPYFEALFDWKPDLARFEREVAEASAKGAGGSLSLAEMECSIDLLDAELMALRGHRGASEDMQRSITELSELRGRLAQLIARMRPLVPEY